MKKLRGLSLFSNVGIAEAGLSALDVDMIYANELLKDRARFYSCVHPETEVVDGDITNDDIRTILVNKAKESNVNFVLATPPCQGMSEAGNRFEFDERNQLITYAVDVIQRVKPEFAIIENVPTILHTKIFVDGNVMLIPDYLKHVLSDYHFNSESLIKAMDHGIPQMRERNIYLLVRNDIDLVWEFPEKEPVVTLESAIGHLPSLDPMLREGLNFTLEKFPDFEIKRRKGLKVSPWHFPPTHSWKQVEWMMHTPS